MLPSFLIGVVAGLRSMTPLAAVSLAARRGALPLSAQNAGRLGHGLLATLGTALAAGELLGDKMKTAPDRTIAPGLAARIFTGAIAGAALAGEGRKTQGAVLGVLGAVAAGYAGLAVRKAAMRRFGQTSTGLVEDAIAIASTTFLVAEAGRTTSSRDMAHVPRPSVGRPGGGDRTLNHRLGSGRHPFGGDRPTPEREWRSSIKPARPRFSKP